MIKSDAECIERAKAHIDEHFEAILAGSYVPDPEVVAYADAHPEFVERCREQIASGDLEL